MPHLGKTIAIAVLIILIAGALGSEPVRSRVLTAAAAPAGGNFESWTLPLTFVENKGQVDAEFDYFTLYGDGNFFFGPGQFVCQLFSAGGDPGDPPGRVANVAVRFLGSNPQVRVKGLEESPGKVHALKGRDPEGWVIGARTYRKLVYEGLYPDTDLVVEEAGGKIKTEFRIGPGGRADRIRMRYEGADRVRVNGEGELEIETAAGVLKDGVPLSFERTGDGERPVASRYVIASDGTVGYRVDRTAEDAELVVDPLVYSSFLGGADSEGAQAVAVDRNGYAYVTGCTWSHAFPTKPGSYDRTFNGGTADAFVAKVSKTGRSLVYSTLLGGKEGDTGEELAVDSAGKVTVAGSTKSPDFPTTPYAYDRSHNGGHDFFIVRLNAAGSGLLFATLLGGKNDEYCGSLVLDASGNACLNGWTYSVNFPTTPGAYHRTFGGGFTDAVAVKLNATGRALVFSTFLGGNDVDYGEAGAVDAAGNVYIAGTTNSLKGFPTTPGAFDRHLDGYVDAFVTKLNSAGTKLMFSTFFGGSRGENGEAMCLDADGNVLLAGSTRSPDLPTTPNAYDKTFSGGASPPDDVFVAKLAASGKTLLYGTYLGKTSLDWASGIQADDSGNAYVAGHTASPNFPVTSDAVDRTFNGVMDVFLAVLDTVGNRKLRYSTYLGGSGLEHLWGMARDKKGGIYLCGDTASANFPVTSLAFDRGYNGGNNDCFITKLSLPAFDAKPGRGRRR